MKRIESVAAIVISIIALIISIKSCNISKQQLNYSINQNTIVMTPLIKEDFNVDSTKLSFFVGKDGMELQAMRIIFPQKIRSSYFPINSKPFEIHCDYFERLGEEYFRNYVDVGDSTILVGSINIPVIIDYSIVNNGYRMDYRENRTFVYMMTCFQGNNVKLDLKNTFLIGNCTFIEDKKQDSIEIERIINSQLIEITNHLQNSN